MSSQFENKTSACCSEDPGRANRFKEKFVLSSVITPAGFVPVVSTELNNEDRIGRLKCRFGRFRDDYKVVPGIYAIGSPDKGSDVFVSANYKLSFDALRKCLKGYNAWVLVLDTRGINVWCAAGKGTFGTGELCMRIRKTGLEKVVTHRRLILPQLGAVGVSAHDVEEKTGFKVVYGPVRAEDIGSFIRAGYKCSGQMRRVTFPMKDRAALAPMEVYNYGRKFICISLAVLFIFGLQPQGILFDSVLNEGLPVVFLGLLAYLTGTVLVPLFLPFIPFRAFALKGALAGLIVPLAALFLHNSFPCLKAWPVFVMTWLFFPSVSSFLALQFTGSSTYTSLSGVKKELKISLPVYISAAAVSICLTVISKITEWGGI